MNSVPQIKEAVNNEKERGKRDEEWAMFDTKFDPLVDFFGGFFPWDSYRRIRFLLDKLGNG
jgi:hypothetical protein